MAAALSLLLLAGGLILPGQALAGYADIVVDADSGAVLHSTNADQQNHPASLTKIMTLYLAFDNLNSGRIRLKDQIPVSYHAAAQAPSRLGLTPGSTVSVENAILGLCTRSANDAAVAIAEYLGGTESSFAQMMTRKARELGMVNTTFYNASGLPNSEQYSSARDMMILARALLRNHGKYYHYFGVRQFQYKGQTVVSHNHLLRRYPGADGIKTGYIAASGFNLVASARRDGRRVIGVVFGGSSVRARDDKMIELLDDGFEQLADKPPVRSPAPPPVVAQLPPAPPPPPVPAVQPPSAPGKPPLPAVTLDEIARALPPPARPVPAPVPPSLSATDITPLPPPGLPENAGPSASAPPAANAAPVLIPPPAPPKPAQPAAVAKKSAPAETPVSAEEDDEEDDQVWSIQVGTYRSATEARTSAQSLYRKLRDLVAGSEVRVDQSKGQHGTFYKAMIAGMDRQTAKDACRRVIKLTGSCLVLNDQ